MPRDGTIVPLFGTSTKGFSCIVSSQRRVNVYVEKDPERGTFATFGRPGLTVQCVFSTGVGPKLIRGISETITYLSAFDGLREVALVVCGDVINLVYSGLNSVGNIGSLETTEGAVGFAKNPTQVLLADGKYGYSIDANSLAVTRITSGWFPAGATSVAFLNGRGFAVKPNTGQLWYSALNDFTAGGSANFYTAESDPDDLRVVVAYNNQLALFGQFTTEFWASGSGTTIIQRVGGAALEWGISAKRSVAKVDRGVVFLGQNRNGDKKVMLLSGYSAQAISTPEIEFQLQSEIAIEAGIGAAYAANGHTFYRLSFPNKVYVFDLTAGTWNEETYGSGTDRGIGNVGGFAHGKYMLADYRTNGRLYFVDPTSNTDDGEEIKRLSVTKHSFASFDRVSVDKLGLEFEAGLGLITGQGSDPKVMIRCSRDLGHTWGNEVWESLGVRGDYGRYPVWAGPFGRGRDFLFEISMTDPIKFAMVSGSLKVRA